MDETSEGCSIVPKSFKWLLTAAPAYFISSDKVHILTEPSDFYETLKRKASTAKKRVTVASLYLGNGQLETDLVNTIDNQLKSNSDLKVNWLLDFSRGSREPKSSREVLLPLVQHEKCQVSLFHSPQLRGILKKLLPMRYNELVALQHMKLYIFDDTLVISGANLSNDYFTNRQDRFWVLENVGDICDFLDNVVTVVAQHSYRLEPDNSVELHPDCVFHPYQGNYTAYCKEVQMSILDVWRDEMEKSALRIAAYGAQCRAVEARGVEEVTPKDTDAVKSSSVLLKSVGQATEMITNRFLHTEDSTTSFVDDVKDTAIFLTLQMKHFGIEFDNDITTRLLQSAESSGHISLASGYFNLTDEYSECLLNSKAKVDILCAHPEANGFFNAKGLAGGIPHAYTQILKDFMSLVPKGDTERISVFEYIKQNWTFHGKGLWYTSPGEFKPNLSVIGSANFGNRSVHRDLESQMILLTSNSKLRNQLEKERCHLFSTSKKVIRDETFDHYSRYVKLWVRCVVPVFKKLF